MSSKLGQAQVFAFSHRRFQEYFPTKLVLDKGNITIKDLLTNPRWRETTVVICQTQPKEIVSQIIEVAWSLLHAYWEDMKVQLRPIIDSDGREIPIEFPWPHGCLHLLGLLQDGFSNRLDLLPDGLRKTAGSISSLATLLGSLPHRIWALEIAGVAPTSELLKIIRPAIADKSHYLSDVAYRQVARLDEVPDDIRAWIKKAILEKLLQLGIFKGSNVVYAQVSRLVNAKDYLAVVRGIQFGYFIDVVSAAVAAGILFVSVLVLPLADKPSLGAISWGAIMIFFGVSFLITSLTITEDEVYFMNRFLVGGASYPLLFFTLYLLGTNYFPFLILVYLSTIMPLLLVFVREFPFEKGIITVLFTPFIALQKTGKRFQSFLNSLKD